MGLIVFGAISLMLWMVLWALGFAARDAGMVAFTLFLAAVAGRTIGQNFKRSSAASSD